MTERTNRVAKVIRRVVGTKLHQLLPASGLTVSAVDVSPDLKYATIWLRSLSPQPAAEVDGLGEYRGRLQAELNANLKTKYTPKLSFKLDSSSDYGAKIDHLLDSIKPN